MRHTQIGVLRSGRGIAVFDQVCRPGDAARAQVYAQHRLSVDAATKPHKLIRAELIGFGGLPGQIAPAPALFPWTDAIQPIVATQEVAAWVADHA